VPEFCLFFAACTAIKKLLGARLDEQTFSFLLCSFNHTSGVSLKAGRESEFVDENIKAAAPTLKHKHKHYFCPFYGRCWSSEMFYDDDRAICMEIETGNVEP